MSANEAELAFFISSKVRVREDEMALCTLVLFEAVHVELANEALQLAVAKEQRQQSFFECFWVENGKGGATAIP